MIELNGLKKTYTVSGVQTNALRGITLKINRGDFVTITGKSGCGKSTLLNILGGLDIPTSGEYLFDGKAVNKMNSKELARFRNQTVGYIFQGFNLISELDIVDNVSLPLGYSGMGLKERRQKSIGILKDLGLEHELHKRPAQLSGGQQQRVAIARAIVKNPRILLADEPTGNLDEENSRAILKIIRQLHKEGTTVILVTHDDEIASVSQNIINIRDGMLVGI
jgi:putative ABC transport system ATP-binding protein